MADKKKFTLSKRCKDLIGLRFSRLVALEPVGQNKWGKVIWKCQCICGKFASVVSSDLIGGKVKSCGCLAHDAVTIHGMRHSLTYNSWRGMKERCYNPKNKYYKYWGGKGIQVCERWLVFKNFLEDMGVRPKGKTLDRINNDKNYELGNCRWATMKEQNNNHGDRKDQYWFLGFNLETGEFDEDNNMSQFAKRHDLTCAGVCHCLHSEQKQHQNWIFDYLP